MPPPPVNNPKASASSCKNINRSCTPSFCEARVVLKQILLGVERGLIALPLIALVGAAGTFFLGGKLTSWHAPIALVGTLATILLINRASWSIRCCSLAAFLSYLFLIWLSLGCIYCCDCDSNAYHLPVVRLLMNGWSPVWGATPEAVTTAFGLAPSEMWLSHVLFITHPIETTNAVFAFWTQAPMSLMFPMFLLLLPLALGALWRFVRYQKWPLYTWLIPTAMLLGEACTFGLSLVVDAVALFAAIGLLVSMAQYLGNRTRFKSILLFSFWMMVSKQAALLECFCFWVVFSAILLWQERSHWRSVLGKLSLCGAILTGALLFTCAAPYITSTIRYGHPLYPAFTANPQKYPTIDITEDFLNTRNEDITLMSAAGLWVNAYLSPSLAHKYYAWKYNRPTFRPFCGPWDQSNNKGKGYDSPLAAERRWPLVFGLLILLLFGKTSLRFIACAMLLGLSALPSQYYGYLRYIPWILLAPALAYAHLLSYVDNHSPARRSLARSLTLAIALLGFGRAAYMTAQRLAAAYEFNALLDNHQIQAIVLREPFHSANMKLLQKQSPQLSALPVILERNAEDLPTVHKCLLPDTYAYLKIGTSAAPSPTSPLWLLLTAYGHNLPHLLYWRICKP